MNTEIKDTIENRLKVTERLLANLYFFKGNIIQISDTNAPYSEVINTPLFNYIYNSSIRLFVIDLMKLIYNSSNEYFNIFKTVNCFNLNQNKKFWKHKIPKKRFIELKEKLLLSKYIFKDIKDLRNKYFAHTDIQTTRQGYIVPKTPLNFLWEYLDVILEVFLEFQWCFKGTHPKPTIQHTNNGNPKIVHQFVYLEDEKTPEFYELYKYKLIRDYSYSILKDDPKNPFIKKYIEIIRS